MKESVPMMQNVGHQRLNVICGQIPHVHVSMEHVFINIQELCKKFNDDFEFSDHVTTQQSMAI